MKGHNILSAAAKRRLARFLEKVTERTTASKSTPDAAQIVRASTAQADVHPAIKA